MIKRRTSLIVFGRWDSNLDPVGTAMSEKKLDQCPWSFLHLIAPIQRLGKTKTEQKKYKSGSTRKKIFVDRKTRQNKLIFWLIKLFDYFQNICDDNDDNDINDGSDSDGDDDDDSDDDDDDDKKEATTATGYFWSHQVLVTTAIL